LCHLQQKLIVFYNRDEKSLLRGTNWVFKMKQLRFVFFFHPFHRPRRPLGRVEV